MFRSILIVLFVMCGLSVSGQQDEVLFHIDDTPITVSEFKYIYEKNNRDKADYSRKSIEEYLDLYINFKLKVYKARSLEYHQSEAYKTELAGYRSQLADSYVIDREVIARMVDEIYSRQQYDVELRHILISVNRKGAQQSQQQALDKINLIKKQIDGGMTFDRAVLQFSQDRNSAAEGGNIGFVSAPLPDGFGEIEDAAYTLQVGSISNPVRSDLGYHILQVVSKRPARGTMEAQHLLIRKEKNGIKLADAYPRIKRIYDNIIVGTTTFDQATIVSSEDKETKGNMGNLGFFGIGQYEQSFEDAAFALKEDGAISPPIETSIGWHLIRRVSKRALDDKNTIKERLKNQPKQGERFERISDEVVKAIKKEASFRENKELLNAFNSTLSEDFFEYSWQAPELTEGQLISFGDDYSQLSEFIDFLKKNNKVRMRAKGQKSIPETIEEIYKSFVTTKAISFAEDRLEERYPEFKNLMREYREGILLFDVTKDFVWDKAASDDEAVGAFYESHRDDYKWEERAKITNYTIMSTTPTDVTAVLNASRKRSPKELTELFNEGNEMVLFNEEVLEGSNKELEGLTLKVGDVSAPVFNNGLKLTTFKKIEEVIPARPKTLKEAKGYVISDYQDQLDKEWVEALKKEYTVKISQKTLKKLIR